MQHTHSLILVRCMQNKPRPLTLQQRGLALYKKACHRLRYTLGLNAFLARLAPAAMVASFLKHDCETLQMRCPILSIASSDSTVCQRWRKGCRYPRQPLCLRSYGFSGSHDPISRFPACSRRNPLILVKGRRS